jgi:hypothetical protein
MKVVVHLLRFTGAGKPAAAAVLAACVSACGSNADPVEINERIVTTPAAAVDVRVRLRPDHVRQAPRYLASARTALTTYARRFAPPPFTSLTIVDPEWHADEVPPQSPLAVARTHWWAPPRAMEPEIAVTRAVGSAFWQSLLGCTNVDSWFVDGLNQYSFTTVIADQASDPRLPGTFGMFEARYFGAFVPDTIRIPLSAETANSGVDAYRHRPTVDVQHLQPGERPIAVAKTALALATMERWLGSETWDAVLAEFAARRWPSCPVPDDLRRVASEVTALDLSWFFHQTFDDSTVFDYAVDRIVSGRDVPSGSYRTTILVRRLGEAEFTGTSVPRTEPFESGRGVELLVRFADGSTRVDRWDGRDRWKTFEYESAARAQSAEVDPRHVLLLDVNRTNNSIAVEPTMLLAASKWAARWSLWLQDGLLTAGSLW